MRLIDADAFFILFTSLCLNSIINGVIKHFRGIM